MANISTFFPSGGGGSTPIGGLAYFIPRPGTAFTAGQEVYTNPDDSTVWIRSGAQITSSGTGVLEASQYADSSDTLVAVSPSDVTFVSDQVRNDRYGGAFDGKNVVYVGFNGSDCDLHVFNVDGTTLISGTPITDDLTTSASIFYNSTHTFIMERYIGNTGVVSIEGPAVDVKYIQTSTLTSKAAYQAAGIKWLAPTSPNPTSEQRVCVTNAGLSNERHWWGGGASTTLAEFTFDSTTPAGSIAWTSTGNSITLPSNPLKIQAEGNNIYVHSGTKVYVYNATTRALTATLSSPNGRVVNTAEIGLILIPSTKSDSSTTEFWFPEHALTGSDFDVDYKRYELTEHLTGPYTGTFTAREAILLKDIDEGATFGADSISAGDGNEDNVYLWKRIA